MSSLLGLLRLVSLFAFNPATIVQEAASGVRRTVVLVTAFVMALGVLFPAAGCLAAALWIFVQHRLGPVWAAVITAAAFVLLAVLIMVVGLLLARPNRRQREPRAERVRETPYSAASLAAAGLEAMPPPEVLLAKGRDAFRRNKSTVLLVAGVAGLIMGQNLLRPRAVRVETYAPPPRRRSGLVSGLLGLWRRF